MSDAKIDGSGLRRRRWRAADAERVLSAWRESGQSLSAYAREQGFAAQRLSFWKKRAEEWAGPVRLAPAVVVGGQAQVSVRFASGAVLEIADAQAVAPEWVAAVARELLK